MTHQPSQDQDLRTALDDWAGATLETRLRSYPAAPPGSDALSCGYVSALMTEAADTLAALTPSAPIAAPVRDDGAQGWLPIESAPTDTPVIVYSPAVERDGLTEWVRVDFVHAAPFRTPTHWMPLPSAPILASLPAPAGDVPGEAQTQEGGRC